MIKNTGIIILKRFLKLSSWNYQIAIWHSEGYFIQQVNVTITFSAVKNPRQRTVFKLELKGSFY